MLQKSAIFVVSHTEVSIKKCCMRDSSRSFFSACEISLVISVNSSKKNASKNCMMCEAFLFCAWELPGWITGIKDCKNCYA